MLLVMPAMVCIKTALSRTRVRVRARDKVYRCRYRGIGDG
jgi:hypothetical protein